MNYRLNELREWLGAALLTGFIIAVSVLLVGCALNPGESRKIVAWGLWTVVLGEPIGIGYWHSERGPSKDIDSEQSAKPPSPPNLSSPIDQSDHP